MWVMGQVAGLLSGLALQPLDLFSPASAFPTAHGSVFGNPGL